MQTIEQQIAELKPDWAKLVSALIPEIQDDFRASEFDDEDSEPSMCLTIGFTPETEERDASWGYQTGDNSFTGGAYSHPHWAVVTLTRDCKPEEIANEIERELLDIIPG
jgi:hypothetical protein